MNIKTKILIRKNDPSCPDVKNTEGSFNKESNSLVKWIMTKPGLMKLLNL